MQLHAEGELFDQFDTPEEAMAAAETAVDPNRGLASDEYE